MRWVSFEPVWCSKEDIYTSKVHYMLRRGRPYIWIPEGELHNTVSMFFKSFGFIALNTLDLCVLREK